MWEIWNASSLRHAYAAFALVVLVTLIVIPIHLGVPVSVVIFNSVLSTIMLAINLYYRVAVDACMTRGIALPGCQVVRSVTLAIVGISTLAQVVFFASRASIVHRMG